MGIQNPQPSVKHDGFLSIENKSQIVFRTLAGRVLFTGILAKKSGKVKICEQEKDKALKFKIKFTAVVTTA